MPTLHFLCRPQRNVVIDEERPTDAFHQLGRVDIHMPAAGAESKGDLNPLPTESMYVLQGSVQFSSFP